MESYHTDATHIHEIISKNLPTIPTSSTKCHMIFMLGSGTELVGRFRLFSSVRYCILPGAVWCGAVHTFSHPPPMIAHIKLAPLAPQSFNWFRCYHTQWLVGWLVVAKPQLAVVISRCRFSLYFL